MNNLDKPQYVSAEGLKKLQAELDELRTVKRAEVAQRIHAAMEFGDPKSAAALLTRARSLEGRLVDPFWRDLAAAAVDHALVA